MQECPSDAGLSMAIENQIPSFALTVPSASTYSRATIVESASASPITREVSKIDDPNAYISLSSGIHAVVPFLQSTGGVKRHYIVLPDADPPSILEGSSVVYVLHIDFGGGIPALFYVGETESIRQRLAQHR